MSRRAILLFALLSPGCVPVTEPVGDIDKAEQDKALVGTWATADQPDRKVLRIEPAPVVKGNPKGLMLMTFIDPGQEQGQPVYFFLATVGKEHYGNLLMDASQDKDKTAKLGEEGQYAKWSKGTGRRYIIFHVATNKEGIVINFGDEKETEKLMIDEKIEKDDQSCFKTPAGWLAKYLEKHGRDTLFPAGKDSKLVKAK